MKVWRMGKEEGEGEEGVPGEGRKSEQGAGRKV
jgi:hypothetical protein